MATAMRLKQLRDEMSQKNIDIYLVPSTDQHNNEYLPKCWERRAWISNFNGSAGEAVITLAHAYVSTDGRYFLQADQQLDPKYFSLIKQTGFAPATEQWLIKNAKGKRLGIDPKLISITRAQQLEELMLDIDGECVFVEENLIDKCKINLGEKLILPANNTFYLSEEYSGQSITNRLMEIQKELANSNADYLVINALDEIAWLFNMRGSDIDFNPLAISYAIVGQTNAWLFIDSHKLSKELVEQLQAAAITTIDYNLFGQHLQNLLGTIWLDGKTANAWILEKINENNSIILSHSPIILKKACKNSIEAQGARVAHTKDALAMINFLSWLEKNWRTGTSELNCVDKLFYFRSQQKNFKSNSFATISGFADNGAVIHYQVTVKTNKIIDDSSLYLIDSGGQYLEGTTDITRTIHLGNPSAKQKYHYTLVLQGHLALARAVFPDGTAGENLDALARMPLWNEYLNYRHGTGHGVGSFLCVHEGPQRISPFASGIKLLPGMIVSNEPGLYFEGEYGIRIENLCLINSVADPIAEASEFGPFYHFENLTLVPYCKNLIDINMLSQTEKQQIQTYYNIIETKLRPLLATSEQQWLDNQITLF